MIQIGVVVQDADFQAMMNSLSVATRDLTPVFRGPIDASVTDFFKRQFDSQGEHGGQRWKPLSPRTVRAKRKRGRGRAGPATILQDTRELWASFTKSGHPKGIRIIQPQRYERGSSLKKALYAQAGAGGAPAREIVPSAFPEPIVRSWAGMIEQYVTKGTA
jgi:hypothetical protein